jgi:hypothetical protein
MVRQTWLRYVWIFVALRLDYELSFEHALMSLAGGSTYRVEKSPRLRTPLFSNPSHACSSLSASALTTYVHMSQAELISYLCYTLHQISYGS